MNAEDVLRQVVSELLERSADAWARDAPHLAERLLIGAQMLLNDLDLERAEDAR